MDNKNRENLMNNTALVNLSLTESVTLGIHKSFCNPKNHVVTIWKGGREKAIILTEEKIKEMSEYIKDILRLKKIIQMEISKKKFKCKADEYNCTLTLRFITENEMLVLTLREGKTEDFHYVLHEEELKTFMEYLGKIK